MTPAVPRWGIAPGAVPLVRGPGGIARGTIVVAAARGFNGDSGSPTGGRDGQSEMRGAGRRDADPQVQWFGAADAPQQQAPAANGGTNANRGGPGGKGAPNPFVRRDASQGGSQGAAATAPGRGGAAPSTPVPSDLNKSGRPGRSRACAAAAGGAPGETGDAPGAPADAGAQADSGDGTSPASPPDASPPDASPPAHRTHPGEVPGGAPRCPPGEGYRADLLHPGAAPDRLPELRRRVIRGAIPRGARRGRRRQLPVDVPPRHVRVDRGRVQRGSRQAEGWRLAVVRRVRVRFGRERGHGHDPGGRDRARVALPSSHPPRRSSGSARGRSRTTRGSGRSGSRSAGSPSRSPSATA
jgi:hypothetical protein